MTIFSKLDANICSNFKIDGALKAATFFTLKKVPQGMENYFLLKTQGLL